MSDLPVYHHVSELMRILDVNEKMSDGVSAASFADLLLKNRTPNISAQVSGIQAAKVLSETCSSPETILKKYDALQMKQRRELDPCVTLLSQIATDKKTGVRQFLKRHAENRLRTKANTQQKMSSEEEPEVKYNSKRSEKFLRSKRHNLSEEDSFPNFPRWMKDNPLLSWDFGDHKAGTNAGGPIGELPLSVQESKLIEDILYCLSGICGEYVTCLPEDGEAKLWVDESSDPSMRELACRILPICSFYSSVMRFVEERMQYRHGLVNHALSAAMRNLLKDYFVLLAQLEHQFQQGQLSLQKLWFYLQPTLKNMELLAFVCRSIFEGKGFGGNVLSILHKIMISHTGDLKAQEVLLYLLQAASVPYFEILEKWIYKGVIFDPHSEFLVEDNDTDKQEIPFNSDEYWEKRYTICRDRIPVFLEKVADTVLRTGKYLNVIQHCGDCIKLPEPERISYGVVERQYVEQVERAYGYSSRKLLEMLTQGSDLMGRLRSLKHYFLVDQGDFLVQFMDMAEEELLKDVDDIMPTRLEFLLELALRTSVVNYDRYKDDVGVEIRPYDLLSQMFKILRVGGKEEPAVSITGVEAFVFHYRVQWPLSLIINRQALACYQMLFRHLFYCKYVERLLCGVWSLNKVAKSFSLDASRTYASAFALRQRMLNFVQNVLYYMMFEVIEPNWHILINKMQEVRNVDEVLHFHNGFLETCLKDCMVTIPDLLHTMVKLLKLCVAFAQFKSATYRDALEAELDLGCNGGLQKCPHDPAVDMDASMTYQQSIAAYHADFDGLLQELLRLLTSHEKEHYSDKMANLWYRLDYSGYYTKLRS